MRWAELATMWLSLHWHFVPVRPVRYLSIANLNGYEGDEEPSRRKLHASTTLNTSIAAQLPPPALH